jgi:hypothetical protein|tara:strand:+ start:94 stop:591 length:498 start_codon:yes stop_codon:yes gene_type:complete
MKIYGFKNNNIYTIDIFNLAEKLGIKAVINTDSSNCFNVKLNRSDNDKYQRTGFMYSENLKRYNKVGAICWHGFRDFMIAMYELDSNLRFVTAQATYKNKDDFYIKFPGTAYKNIGSYNKPLNYGDACLCDVPNSVSVSANEIKDHPTYRMDPAYWIARKSQVNN